MNHQTLESFVRSLPAYIGKEIFTFLVPNSSSGITFQDYYTTGWCDNHSSRYMAAFSDGGVIKNKNGEYLSRIYKKNNRHRYYISKIVCVMVNEDEYRSNHRASPEYEDFYRSRYVGKNIDKALLELFM
jgi:hypothetical protein